MDEDLICHKSLNEAYLIGLIRRTGVAAECSFCLKRRKATAKLSRKGIRRAPLKCFGDAQMPDLNLDIKHIINRLQRHQPTRLQHLLKNVDDAPRVTTAPLSI